VIWAAGIRAAPVAARLGLPTGKSGRLRVDRTLRVLGAERVFAAGDVALVEEEPVPQLAQGAIQGGAHAAENVLRAHRGTALLPFRYRDKGMMATIGRSRAVATIYGWNLEGWLAWWAWLVIHLVMLVGFRNRLAVLVDWIWNYLTYDRGLRAMLGAPPAPAPETKTGSAP
jgi:NADH dehydrogenase